jgi:hypothetical protein
MTKEITEGNKLIAKFMGIATKENNEWDIIGYSWDYSCDADYKEFELCYEYSWDWLMPVVEEIKDMHDLHNLQNTIIYLIHKQGGMDARLNSISDLWMAVVEFIKSDNQNLKSKNNPVLNKVNS